MTEDLKRNRNTKSATFSKIVYKGIKNPFLTDLGQITEGVFNIKMHQEKEEAVKLYLCGITAEQLVKSMVLYY